MSITDALPPSLQIFYSTIVVESRGPLIGLIVGFVLFGIILSQTVYYYRAYPDDKRRNKILVAVLCILEIAHLACLIQAAWVWFIYAKTPERVILLFRAPIGFSTAFLISFLITTLVQGFYAWRVWLFSSSNPARNYVVGLILVLNVAQFVCGLVTNIPQYGVDSISNAHSKVRSGFFSAQLAISMAGDTIISASLVIFLRQAYPSYRSSRNAVDRLVTYSVGVGMLSAATAIATFIVYHAYQQTFHFVALVDIISKVYVNSLLVTLNSRRSIREAYDSKTANTYQLQERSTMTTLRIAKTVETAIS